MQLIKSFPSNKFNILIEKTFDEIKKLSKLKGGEYSGDDDRLANFRRNGTALSLPMETIWAVYAAKHWDALMQYVSDLNTGIARTRMESLEGRCDDLIVYLLLFKAMLSEKEVYNIKLNIGQAVSSFDTLNQGILKP